MPSVSALDKNAPISLAESQSYANIQSYIRLHFTAVARTWKIQAYNYDRTVNEGETWTGILASDSTTEVRILSTNADNDGAARWITNIA